jgi:flagellar motor switch protein FliM
MAEEVLSQDEMDALLNGVNSGAVETTPEQPGGEVRPLDLVSHARVVRQRMPTVELINERFARQLRVSLFGMLHREAPVSIAPIRTQRLGDYLRTLQVPTSINLARISPLSGTALVVFDPRLVSALVDSYFGGSGRQAKIEGRDFSATESQIIRSLLDQSLGHLAEAWRPVVELKCEYLGSESNPQFVNCAGATEVMVVSCFAIDFEGGSGEMHLILPYAAIEALKARLDAGIQGDGQAVSGRWEHLLAAQLEEADVELVTLLGSIRSSVGELRNLRPGMILPCDFDGTVTAFAEGVPIARGALCEHRGQRAVQVRQRVRTKTDIALAIHREVPR